MMIRRYDYGMTLIEIVIVIAIIATLASVAIPTLITSLDVQDNKNTKSSMNALKTAMLNYYRDVGTFPNLSTEQKAYAAAEFGIPDFDNLDALVYNPFNPDSDDVKEYINSENWKGPYILSSFNRDDYKFDAWGQKYFYDPNYAAPQYMMGAGLGAFNQTTSTTHGGAGEFSSNAVLLVSQGKVKGFGRRENSQGQQYQGWFGVVDWEKLQRLSPVDIYPPSDDDYIAMIVDPRAERAQGTHGSYDDEKINATKKMLESVKEAVIDFVYDIGVTPPYNTTGAVNDVRVPIDSHYFSQFQNPLLMLTEYFRGDPDGSASGGKVKDRIPLYKAGYCYSFNTEDGKYAQMGWKGPYFKVQGSLIDNGSIPAFEITYRDFIDSWGNPLQVPFPGDNIWDSFGAVFDPTFGNVPQNDPAYDATYNKYSGIMISGGPNGVLNSAIETKSYLDPSQTKQISGSDPAMSENDDIWVYISKNEIMSNFAPSGNVSRALDAGNNVSVITGLNINFQFPGNPGDISDSGNINYKVINIAFIFAEPSQPYCYKLQQFANINYPINSVDETYINRGFTKDNLQIGDFMSTEQFYVPIGRCFVYALIEAYNITKDTGKPENFPGDLECKPYSSDDAKWLLNTVWANKLDINTQDNDSNRTAYGIYSALLEITSGSGTYTITIPVDIAKSPKPGP